MASRGAGATNRANEAHSCVSGSICKRPGISAAPPTESKMTKNSSPPTRRAFVAGLTATALPTSVLGQQRLALPRYPRGAQVPPRLKFLMKAQNEAAESLNRLLGANADFMKTNPRFAQTPQKLEPKWDWREQGYVTPVKSQGPCGSCWAFAAVGAFEAAYAITNKQWIDISEQELLDCAFGDVNCVGGGWHQAAFMYMQYAGLIDSYRYYYTGIKGQCTANFQRKYFVLNWNYVGQRDNQVPTLIPSDPELKKAIRQYGPVATGVQTTNWETYWKMHDDGTQNPSWYTDFPNGIFQGEPSDNDASQVDHVVVMVGWDDSLGDHGVWIIKNSWGVYWGDGGYMLLPYGRNNIGFGASWAAVYPTSGLSPALIETLQIAPTR
jgi:C1A family cysteine protease